MGLALFIFFWAIGTIYLAIALALCVAVVMLGYWGWSKLPGLFGEGPDSADLKEREKRAREIEAKRRDN